MDIEKNLQEIIKPLRTAKWEADYQWDRIEPALANMGLDYGGLELEPDFQRGHVWTETQQVHFIENCLRGVVASSGYLIQFNCANWNNLNDNIVVGDLPVGLQCVDGLQRYTAVTEFVKGNVKPFGLHISELVGTSFAPRRMMVKVAIRDFTMRSDLLEHYLSINSGGTPHSAEEIARVRYLLEKAKAENK